MSLSFISNCAAGAIGCFHGITQVFFQIGIQTLPIFEDEPRSISDEAKKHADLLKREGIRDDFILLNASRWINASLGTNWPKITKAAIVMLEGLKNADEDAYDYLLINTFKRLKDHSGLWESLAMVVVNVATYTFGYYMTSNEWAACSISLVSAFCFHRYQIHRSNKSAENFAFKNATLPQLDGRIRLLKGWLSFYRGDKSKVDSINLEIQRTQNEMNKRFKESPDDEKSLLSFKKQEQRERAIKRLLAKIKTAPILEQFKRVAIQ